MYGGLKKLLFGQAQTLRVKSKSLLQKVFTSYAKHYQLLNALDAKQLNFYHNDRLVTEYNVTVEDFGLQSEGTIEVVFICNGNKDDTNTDDDDVDDIAVVERDADSIYIDSDVNKASTSTTTTSGDGSSSNSSSSGGYYSSQYAEAIRCGRYMVEQIEVGPPVVRSTTHTRTAVVVESIEDEQDDFQSSYQADSTGDTPVIKQDTIIVDDVSSFSDAEVIVVMCDANNGVRDAKTVVAVTESSSAIANDIDSNGVVTMDISTSIETDPTAIITSPPTVALDGSCKDKK